MIDKLTHAFFWFLMISGAIYPLSFMGWDTLLWIVFCVAVLGCGAFVGTITGRGETKP